MIKYRFNALMAAFLGLKTSFFKQICSFRFLGQHISLLPLWRFLKTQTHSKLREGKQHSEVVSMGLFLNKVKYETLLKFGLFVALLVVILLGCVDRVIPSKAAQDQWPNPVGNISVLKKTEPNPVGTMPGIFSVDQNGAATYNISLDMIPGINDVQPTLSLFYNSQVGVGPLGIGWVLSEVPSIQRCPRTIAQDAGLNGGVNLDTNDKFCMDGIRLVAIEGSYGENNTIYSTESQTYTKIISYTSYKDGTSCAAGPCYFEAFNKDGTKLEFGARGGVRDPSSFMSQDQPNVVLAWNISKITDLNGNFVTTEYNAEGQAQGEYYVTELNYTGNMATGAATQRRVAFLYDQYSDRSDDYNKYVGNSLIKMTRRLGKIQTSIQEASSPSTWQVVSTYELAYKRDPYNVYDILTSVKRCDANNVCVQPTTFLNGEGKHTFSTSYVGQWTGGQVKQVLATFPMDVNGDGIDDIVEAFNDRDLGFIISFAKPGGGISKTTTQKNLDPDNNLQGLFPMDLNGDGKMDLVQGWGARDICFIYYISNGEELQKLIKPDWDCKTGHGVANIGFFPVDYDGDGRTDLVQLYEKGGNLAFIVFKYSMDLQSLVPFIDITTNHSIGSDIDRTAIDVNGDGCTDIVQIYKSSNNIALRSYLSRCSLIAGTYEYDTPTGVSYTNPSSFSGIYSMDINGDKLSDILYIQSDSNLSSFKSIPILSKGKNFTVLPATDLPKPADTSGKFKFYTMDANGDGFDDVVRIDCLTGNGNCQSSSYVNTDFRVTSYISKRSFFIAQPSQTSNNWYSDIFLPVDNNGDGIADLVQMPEYNGNYIITIFLSKLIRPFVDQIVNGLNGSTVVTYRPLTDPQIYTKSSGSVYPTQDTQSTLHVVKAYIESDGRDLKNGGYSYSHSYNYSGAKVDLFGRGWMGFQQVKLLQNESGIERIENYLQPYPKTGLVQSTQILDFNRSPVVTQQASTYTYSNLQEGKDSRLNEVVLSTETATIYNPSGIASYSLSKNYFYDNYGNLNMEGNLADSRKTVLPVWKCIRYINEPEKNQFGYLSETKLTKNKASCEAFIKGSDTWSDSSDISWDKRSYDASKNVISYSVYDNMSTLSDKWNVTHYANDLYGNNILIKDNLGAELKTEYDGFYHTYPIKVTTPRPSATTNPLIYINYFEPYYGYPITMIDPNNLQHWEDYDRLGRISDVRETSPSGASTIISNYLLGKEERIEGGVTYTDYYTEVKDLVSWDKPEWQWTRSYVNALGVTYQNNYTGPEGKILETKEIFDKQGRLVEATLPYFKGATIIPSAKAEFNSYNYPIKITSPDGSVVCNTYIFPSDSQLFTRVTTVTRFSTSECGGNSYPDDQTTVQYLDSRGNMVRNILPNGGEATYLYDPIERIAAMQDPEGVQTGYLYDSLSRLRSVASGDKGIYHYLYDIYDRLIQTKDADGRILKFNYDLLRRITSQTDEAVGETITFTYDESITTPASNNGLGRLTTVMVPHNANQIVYKYSYDQNGVESGLSVMRENGKLYNFSYINDPQERIVSYTFPDSTAAKYIFTPAGYLSSINLENLTVSYKNFNELGDPTSITYSNNGKAVVETTQEFIPAPGSATSPYGSLKNLLVKGGVSGLAPKNLIALTYGWKDDSVKSILDNLPNPTNNQNFGYQEEMNFLTSASGAYGNQEFTYNKAGSFNRKSNATYTYKPSTHHIATINPLRLGERIQALNVLYYKNGNLLSKPLSSNEFLNFTYDARANLRQVNKSSTNKQASMPLGHYLYDHNDTRMTKIDAAGGVTQYIVPLFEVATPPGKETQYTKYIDGLYGRAALITHPGDGLNLPATKKNKGSPK